MHGHDSASLNEMKSILYDWGLKPIVTKDQASNGDLLLDKILRDVKTCACGIVLLTPDDYGYANKSGKNSISPRARQNVIFEMGILTGVLGKRKVLTLLKSGIEKPSDMEGIIYHAYTNEIKETQETIRKEFRALGIELKE